MPFDVPDSKIQFYKRAEMNTAETLRLVSTIQEAADAIAQLAIKQPIVFAALGLRHPLVDELSGFAGTLRESAAKEMSSKEFWALQQEGEGLERDIAMGNDSEAGDIRMAQITKMMELSPWMLHPDYGCIQKKDLALADAIQVAAREKSNQAEKAFSDYDFGDGVMVTDTSGWEYISPGNERTRAVYVETAAEDDGPGPRWKLTFTARFDPSTGTLTEAYAIDSKGQIWGSLPARDANQPTLSMSPDSDSGDEQDEGPRPGM